MTYDELVKALAPEINLTPEMVEKFKKYCALLQEWNQKFNLTAITKEPEVIEKHFYDSLIPAKTMSFDGFSILDIGTGAGFPGMCYAIVYPKSSVYLLDATAKKCVFLNEVKKELGLGNVMVVNSRAETFGHRESFDVVTARALSNLPTLLELAAPMAKVGGFVLAMKGSSGHEELAKAASAIKTLSLKVENVVDAALPNAEGARVNIFFKKLSKSDGRYPRLYSDIVKKPL